MADKESDENKAGSTAEYQSKIKTENTADDEKSDNRPRGMTVADGSLWSEASSSEKQMEENGKKDDAIKSDVDENSGTEVEEKMDVDESSEKESDTEVGRCYCNKERTIGSVELHCGYCMHVFHASCVQCYLGKCIPFMTNYQFFCKNCSPNGLESFTRKQASFSQMCQTTIANLMMSHPDKKFFSKDKDIVSYIEKHWEKLTPITRRIKPTWHNTVAKTMMKEIDIFVFSEKDNGDTDFGLLCPDLSKICPNYDALFKTPGSSMFKPDRYALGSSFDGKTRGTKRKALDNYGQIVGKQKKSDQNASTKVSQFGYPMDHPFNKDGYRWILAEADPHAANRDAFDASIEWAGKAIPGYLYRKWLGNDVLLAVHDRAPQLKLSEDRLTVTGSKGYSMIRATHGVNYGCWYYEVTITEMPPDTSTRIGWSQLLGNLQAPCGYDKFSYSFRSLKGTSFHQSMGKHYSDGYGEGDVMGFCIDIPQPENPGEMLPATFKDRPLVKFKNHLYFEEKDHIRETEKKLISNAGSKIIMYKNGESQKVAFTDIFKGYYYPAISLYKNATVMINFGPDFKCPPDGLKDYRPMSEAAEHSIVSHALADALHHIEHEDNLPEF